MNPELLYKYVENTATDAEMKQVLDWLDADPAHQRELDELDKVLAASIIHGAGIALQGPGREPGRITSVRRIVRYVAEFAAVVVIGFCVAWLLVNSHIGEWSRKMATLEVPAGNYLRMTLQDGTTVWLNSGTTLEYPLVFAGDERRVKVSGEAMFDVRYDADNPFVVETFAGDVEVLGTKFDVAARQDKGLFSTAVLRGCVKVTSRLTPSELFVLEANDKVQLAGRYLTPGTIDDQDEFLWTEGMISIKGVPFEELMLKFENSFGVKIIVDRDSMPVVNYNYGKIRISDGVDSAMSLLQMASDFTYTRNEDGTIVIR